MKDLELQRNIPESYVSYCDLKSSVYVYVCISDGRYSFWLGSQLVCELGFCGISPHDFSTGVSFFFFFCLTADWKAASQDGRAWYIEQDLEDREEIPL